jgi:S-(hydroxymethyl)glutathione dehydrogenase/alcohol dehydrogenase
MSDEYSQTRRALLKGAAAVAAGGALIGGASAAQAKPAINDGSGDAYGNDLGPNMAGTRFKAVVSVGFGEKSTRVMELTMLPINERQIVIRTESSQCCYTMCSRVLGTQAPPDPLGPQAPVIVNDPNEPSIQGHGGVGRVVAVGSAVRRVRVGDRVIVPVTPHCGVCYSCLQGRADNCQWGRGAKTIPIATMADGTPVVQAGNLGGLAEYMVEFEEFTVPVFTDVSSEELSLLHCVGGCGLGTAMTLAPIKPGSTVAVFGLGPVGMSAVQGARIAGASRIIGIDPIRARREAALKFGATHVLDPNETRDWALVTKIKELSRDQSNRIYAGGTFQRPNRAGIEAQVGPDYVIEACGRDRMGLRDLGSESSPDPTGIKTMQQIFQTVPNHGHLCTTGVGFDPQDMLSFPANQWLDGSRQHHSSQFGGTSSLRDIPNYVRLIEAGQYNAKGMITTRYDIGRIMDAYHDVAYRKTLTAVVNFA